MDSPMSWKTQLVSQVSELLTTVKGPAREGGGRDSRGLSRGSTG